MVAVDGVDAPRRAGGGGDEGVEPVGRQHPVDPLGTRQPLGFLAGGEVGGVARGRGAGGLLESLLAEQGQLARVAGVEGDQVRQAARSDGRGRLGQIGVDLGVELGVQHRPLVLVDTVAVGQGDLHQRGAGRPQHRQGGLVRRGHLGTPACLEPQHADPPAPQAVQPQGLRIVLGAPAGRGGGGIGGILAGHGGQQHGEI